MIVVAIWKGMRLKKIESTKNKVDDLNMRISASKSLLSEQFSVLP